MVMSKTTAEAAVKALRETKNSVFFEMIKNNQHSMEKHFSKATAMAGADDYPQGYFKASYGIEIHGREDFNTKLTDNKKADVRKLLNNPKDAKQLGLRIGQYNKKHEDDGPLTVHKTKATNASAILDITTAVLSGGCSVHRNNVNPDTRFLAIGPIPQGFVGRTVDGDGVKGYGIDHAVVVINAPLGSAPQVVTVFPADDTYVNGRPLLT